MGNVGRDKATGRSRHAFAGNATLIPAYVYGRHKSQRELLRTHISKFSGYNSYLLTCSLALACTCS